MLTINVTPESVQTVLDRLAEKLAPAGMRGMMKTIGEALVESTAARFQSGIAPDGSRWPAISENTVLARIKAGRSGTKPLIDTGDLSNPDTHGPVYQVTDGGAGVVVGVRRVFGKDKNEADASVHQFGTSRAGRGHKVTIPARPFLGLSAEDERTVLDIIEAELSAL